MRSYELMGLGSVQVSNYSRAVTNRFPSVFTTVDSSEAAPFFTSLTRDELLRLSDANVRTVMTDATVYDRLNSLFEIVGIEKNYPSHKILVITGENPLSQYHSQLYVNVTYDVTDDYDYIAQFSRENDYGEYYLIDLLNAFKYTDVDFVTKDPEAEGSAHTFQSGRARADHSLYKKDCIVFDGILSGSYYKLGSYELNDPAYLTPDLKELAVIIPVFNNAAFLESRALPSLRRSSVFNKMRLYLIDDASTDPYTPILLERLSRQYDNVVVHTLKPPASGSASRGRNIGISLAREPYVTFLDPDNEAAMDGYADLLSDIKKNAADFSFGSYKIIDRNRLIAYFGSDKLLTSPKKTLATEKFRPHSIQACVISASFLKAHNITSPEGGIGQDSLFFMEMMIHAQKASYMNRLIHYYYADRSNSVTNQIDVSFFEKMLITEKRQVEVLKQHNLLKPYITHRLPSFMKDWYEVKLDQAFDKPKAQTLIDEILRLYEAKE
jgi:glycosyltransferase involved in cell wall biosynthesis